MADRFSGIYAGIGSRQTPPEVLALMQQVARRLEAEGWGLRSGGAPGADSAFEAGVSDPRYRSIYLPAASFNNRRAGVPSYIDSTQQPGWAQALETVARYHPAPERLSPFVRQLMATSAMQIFGGQMNRPVDMVLAWTQGAGLVGGTAQALRMAQDAGIPILNLGDPTVLAAAQQYASGQISLDDFRSRAGGAGQPQPFRSNSAITTAMEPNQSQGLTAKEAAEWLVSTINQQSGYNFDVDDATALWRTKKARDFQSIAAQLLGTQPQNLAAELPHTQTSARTILSPTGRKFSEAPYIEPSAYAKAKEVPRYRDFNTQTDSNLLGRIIYGSSGKQGSPPQGTSILNKEEKNVARALMTEDIARAINDRYIEATIGSPVQRSLFGRYGTTSQHVTIPAGLGPTIPSGTVLFSEPLSYSKQTRYITDLGETINRKTRVAPANLSNRFVMGDALSNGWQAIEGNPADIIPVVTTTESSPYGGPSIKALEARDSRGRVILNPLTTQIFKDSKGVTRVFGDPLVATTTISRLYEEELQPWRNEVGAMASAAQDWAKRTGKPIAEYFARKSDPDLAANFALYSSPLDRIGYQDSQARGEFWNQNRAELDQGSSLSDYGMQQWQTELLANSQPSSWEPSPSQQIGQQVKAVQQQMRDAYAEKDALQKAATAAFKKGDAALAASLSQQSNDARRQGQQLWLERNALEEQQSKAAVVEIMGTSQVPQVIADARTGQPISLSPGRLTVKKTGTEVDLFADSDPRYYTTVYGNDPRIVWPEEKQLPANAGQLAKEAELIAALKEETQDDILDKSSAIARLLSVKKYGPSDAVTPFVTDTEGRIQFRNRGGVNIPRVSPRQMKLWDRNSAALYYGLNPTTVAELRDELQDPDNLVNDPMIPPDSYDLGRRQLSDNTRTPSEFMPHGNINQSSAGFLADAMEDLIRPFVDAQGQGHFMPSSRLVPAGTVQAQIRKAPEPVLGVLARGLYTTPRGSSGLYPPMPIKPGIEPQTEFTIDAPQLQRNVLIDPNIMRQPNPSGGLVGGISRASIQAAVDRAIQEEIARREDFVLEPIRDRTGALISPPSRVFSPEAFASRRDKTQAIKRLFS